MRDRVKLRLDTRHHLGWHPRSPHEVTALEVDGIGAAGLVAAVAGLVAAERPHHVVVVAKTLREAAQKIEASTRIEAKAPAGRLGEGVS